MRESICAAVVCAVVAMTSGSARADSEGALHGQKLIVVPLGGTIPNVPSSATAKMSEKLLSTLRQAGGEASMAQSSLEDLLMLNGCSFDQDKCLVGVARTLGVDALFLGQVSGSAGGETRLELRHVPSKGAVVDHEIALRGKSESELVAQLGDELSTLYPPPAAEPPPIEAPERSELVAVPPKQDVDDDRGGFSFGNVRGYTWAMTGLGLAAAAGGTVFLVLANDKQNQIDDHRTETLADLQDLEDLEDSAKTQYLLGDALLIGGGVVAAVGVGLILYQGSRGNKEDPMIVTPVITRDTAGVALTWTLQ